MFGGAVRCISKKQGCVAQNSAEFEFRALSDAAKEPIWLSSMLKFTKRKSLRSLSKYFSINQGVIKIDRKNSSGTRTKHICIHFHFFLDSLAKNIFNTDYFSNTEMNAYILSKLLICIIVHKNKASLGLKTLSTFDCMVLRLVLEISYKYSKNSLEMNFTRS